MVRHHGAEENTLGPDDCKAYGPWPGANTDTKLLIYGLFQKGRVLAQDGVVEYCSVAQWNEIRSFAGAARRQRRHRNARGSAYGRDSDSYHASTSLSGAPGTCRSG